MNGRVSKEEFSKAFNTDSVKQETREMFEYAQRLGVRGFPATVLLYNDQLYLIANGYLEADYVIMSINQLVEEKMR